MSRLSPEDSSSEQKENAPQAPPTAAAPGRAPRGWLARLRARRLRFPLGRSISLLTFLSAVMLILVAAAGAIGFQISNRPIFCVSCHEMGVHYATWRQSSHKEVGCEECHIMPGMVNMLRTKFSAFRQIYLHQKGGVQPSLIQGHVADENCKYCHPETRDLIVYHSLRITHKKHWGREISCTFCHDRVVHGPRVEALEPGEETAGGRAMAGSGIAAYKYTPRMATCLTCHDDKKAPNACSTCHVVLGERRAAAFNPDWVEAHKENVRQEGRTCTRCHQEDFCANCHRAANPHPSDWRALHAEAFKENPSSCPVCHRAPHEKPRDLRMAFCRSCHSLRREHKRLNWLAEHQQEFRTDPQRCSRCHSQAWCADCHQMMRSHPPFWLQTHPAQAKKPDSCRTCHAEHFCIACHKGKGPGSIPVSHKDRQGWLKTHKAAVEKGAEGCSVCHETDFCQACHRQALPTSHEQRWLRLHGGRAQEDSRSCLTCHKQGYCTSCHGVEMPHPSAWLERHGRPGKKAEKTCKNCHAEVFCQACHRGLVPSSHEPAQTWLARHGKAAKSGKPKCEACHLSRLCDSCHGLEMPHPAKWKPQGHASLAKSDPRVCARCHKADYCDTCHGVKMPHPGGWLEEHPKEPKASLKPESICFRCHEKAYCATCHGE